MSRASDNAPDNCPVGALPRSLLGAIQKESHGGCAGEWVPNEKMLPAVIPARNAATNTRTIIPSPRDGGWRRPICRFRSSWSRRFIGRVLDPAALALSNARRPVTVPRPAPQQRVAGSPLNALLTSNRASPENVSQQSRIVLCVSLWNVTAPASIGPARAKIRPDQ
jgi:hypothetical protein